MTQWIQSTNTKQDGTPVTRVIKIPEIDQEIWFTDNAYAEVPTDIAEILADQINTITKVSEPSDPGTYYGDAGQNTQIKLVIANGAFDSLTARVVDADSVSTWEVQHNPIEENDPGVNSRDVVSTEAMDLYVDATAGSDDAEGTESDPIKSLKEVFRRLPTIIQHPISVYFADGTYDAAFLTGMHIVTSWKTAAGGPLRFIGNTDTPSNVVFGGGKRFNLQIQGNAPHRTGFEGIQWETQIDGYNSNFYVENCHIHSTTDDNQTAVGVGGYQCHIRVVNSTFGGTTEYAFAPKQGTNIEYKNCDGSVSTSLVYAVGSGRVSGIGSNTISYPDFGASNANAVTHIKEGGVRSDVAYEFRDSENEINDWEVIDKFLDDGDRSTAASYQVTGLSDYDLVKFEFRAGSSDGGPLTMTVNELADGAYDYVLRDPADYSTTPYSSENQWVLGDGSLDKGVSGELMLETYDDATFTVSHLPNPAVNISSPAHPFLDWAARTVTTQVNSAEFDISGGNLEVTAKGQRR
ncbi:hypothetical protein [Halosimplex sp. J119]